MKSKHYPAAALLFVLFVISTFYLNAQIVPNDSLSPGHYLQQVKFLASDDLKGRGNGSPELQRAGDYIANQFQMAGLKPAGDNGTYFQNFEITTGAELGPNGILQINGQPLTKGADFVGIKISAGGIADGAVVFAGYGITAANLDWDDYKNIDVKGKIVVVFRHEPQELDDKSKFEGKNFTVHASFVNKAINARQHGATGIIFITDPNNHKGEPDVVGPATQTSASDDLGIVAIHATRASLAPTFEKLGKNLEAIQAKMDSSLQPQSFELTGVTARASADVTRVRKTIRNVIGALPGSDPALKNEWIAVGAHYDHLGLGDENSLAPSAIGQIHHGADDNASGTAGVLELAAFATHHADSFKRSILFMTFSGEELGLFGSDHFVNHPTVPLASIAAMINMDMIGRLNNDKLTVIGVGTAAEFKPWLVEDDKAIGLNISYSNSSHEGSDHVSFNNKRIPILFFFSGLHADYHKPSDTADKINAKGAVQILSLVEKTMERVANIPARPQYITLPAEPQPATSSGGGGYGPYFGSVPDFRDDLNGVLFSDVHPDSPAGKAGLKAGDLMVEFDGKPIKNLYDFTYVLGSKKAGDVVTVVVQRNGQPLRVSVTLEPRK